VQPRTALGSILLVALDWSEEGKNPASAMDRDAVPTPAPDLDPLLQQAIAAGVMTEAQARDVDALADGLCARGRAGEITEEQAHQLAREAAQRDGEAFNRARARRRRP
jgi:hypothetical protein